MEFSLRFLLRVNDVKRNNYTVNPSLIVNESKDDMSGFAEKSTKVVAISSLLPSSAMTGKKK
jgi:hypothetical protein